MKLFKVTTLFLAIIMLFSTCSKEKNELEGDLLLTASDNYPLGVVLNWNEISSADMYTIYRKLSIEPEDNYHEIISVETTTYFDTSAAYGSFYNYYIEASSSSASGLIASNKVSGNSVPVTTANSFSLLAELTGGVYTTTPIADSLTSTIISIINIYAKQGADIMLLIDKTGSMTDDIFNVQQGLTAIISAMPPSCNLGIASYGDVMVDSVCGSLYGNDWYDFQDLTPSPFSSIQTIVNGLTTTGGGGMNESVFDGIHRTIGNASWSSVDRLILVIGDAPPLVNPCLSSPWATLTCESECTVNSIMDVVNACLGTSVAANLYPVLIGGGYANGATNQ